MFDVARDSVSVLEERELLQQIVSLGVGYHYGGAWGSNAAISDIRTFNALISKMVIPKKYFDVGNMIHEIRNRIRNGEGGYYQIDLYNGCMLSKGKHSIKDLIIDFTLVINSESILGSANKYSLDINDRFRLRRGKENRLSYLYDVDFLISPNGVFFVWKNRVYVPLNEFHMISFVSLDNYELSFVVDYDAAQNNKPLVIFPCEENYNIIQDQLDDNDRCIIKEYKSLYGDNRFDW